MHMQILPMDALARYGDFDNHEQVTVFFDVKTGLLGVIAVHNSNLGVRTSADGLTERHVLGGVREMAYWKRSAIGFPSVDIEAGITDALRLSRGMTYKNACCGIPYGGGKAVIVTPPSGWSGRDAAYRAFGEAIMRLNSGMLKYNTAEDSGTSPGDMKRIAETCDARFVSGRPSADGDNDPSPFTALGVYHAIRAAWAHRVGGPVDLRGVTVVVQGVGNVGTALVPYLFESGAHVVVSDIDNDRLNVFANICPRVRIIDPDKVYTYPADIFAPCALGGVLNKDTIPLLCSPVIAGAANNQLATREDGHRLMERGIVYVPDYIGNAGGVIEAAEQLENDGRVDVERVTKRVLEIGPRTAVILEKAREFRVPPSEIADEMARRLIYGEHS